jgi:hypothetical protein
VNREVCRRLGIASVVVMPVVNDDGVLGVFELFSGKANAFGERDVSAVQRLSQMVETAVRLAQAVEELPQRLNLPAVGEFQGDLQGELEHGELQQRELQELQEDQVLEEPVLAAEGVKEQVVAGAVEEEILEYPVAKPAAGDVAGEKVGLGTAGGEALPEKTGGIAAQEAVPHRQAASTEGVIPSAGQLAEAVAKVEEAPKAEVIAAVAAGGELVAAAAELPKETEKEEKEKQKEIVAAVAPGVIPAPAQPAVPSLHTASIVAEAAAASEASSSQTSWSQASASQVKGEPELAGEVVPKKPLFWSAAPTVEGNGSEEADQSHVPPVLRSLRKCEACGFPVSAGRALCVDCEEKKWRGHLKGPSAGATRPVGVPPATPRSELAASSASPSVGQAVSTPAVSHPAVFKSATGTSTAASGDFVLSAGLEPPQSWVSANKYILLTLLVVGVVAVVVFLLR